MEDPFVALERELSRMFRRAHGASHEISALAHPDLDAELYSLLGYIDRHPGSLAKNLAAEFRLDPATVSRQLGRADSAGLISRSPDPNDSRGMTIELTPAGRTVYEAARTARTTLVHATLHEWTSDDVGTLASLLKRLVDLDLESGQVADVAESMIRSRTSPTGDEPTSA